MSFRSALIPLTCAVTGIALTACGGAPTTQPTSMAEAGHHAGHEHGAHAGHGHGAHAGHGHEAHAGHGAHAMKHAGGVHHRFDDAAEWARRFEDPKRDAWQKPDEVVSRLVTRPDLTIADIGAGTGYFPVRFAKAAPQGRVLGLDIEQGMVDYLNARAKTEGIANLGSRKVPTDDPQLGADKPDLVFLCNTYHHIMERTAYFTKVKAQVAPGGRLAVVDFHKTSEIGPPPEHKLAPEVVIAELEAAGWALKDRHDLPEQYLLVFE